jgi:poly(beta-D-mannuronate) lyase
LIFIFSAFEPIHEDPNWELVYPELALGHSDDLDHDSLPAATSRGGRGGSDESTAGPYITIRHCNFADCCNKERGSVMRLIGPQVLTVENCNFDNSGRGGATIRLDEATWEKVRIANCNLWNSGRMVTTTSQAIQGKMYNIRPAYINADAYNYTPVPGSELEKLSIGLKKNSLPQ